MPRYRLTMKWKDDHGVIKRWADTTPFADADVPLSGYSMQDPQFAVKNLFLAFDTRRFCTLLFAKAKLAFRYRFMRRYWAIARALVSPCITGSLVRVSVSPRSR